jgi:hypothetical protein
MQHCLGVPVPFFLRSRPMKASLRSTAIHLTCVSTLAALLAACSAVKEGRVVKKGIDPGTKLHPEPIHWIDIRGENRQNRVVTVRMEFFAMDWKAIDKGDWIAPASFGLPRFFQRIHAYNEEQRRESGRFSSSGLASRTQPKATRSKRIARRQPAESAPASEASLVAASEPTAASREEKYRAVREKAIEDESVRALKKRIHTATSDDEQTRAWREYRSALRDKMHALDPSLGDLIDRAEEPSPAASPTQPPP